MKKYIVYCHTLNNKKYVGYTGKTLLDRLADHIAEANAGSNRHFCRAIRKYGAENIISEELWSTETRVEAKRKEREFIKKLNSFSMGYNMTKGGDGGNTIEKFSAKRLAEYKRVKSIRSSGMSNGNAKPGVTKEIIIESMIKFIVEHNKCGEYVLRKEIEPFLYQNLKVSSMIIKNRFSGYTQLFEQVNAELLMRGLVDVKYNPYYRGADQKQQLAKVSAKQRWVTDGIKNVKLTIDELDKFLEENKTYKPGRTL